MYQKIDKKKYSKQPERSEKIMQALQQNNLDLLADSLYNIFETVVEEKQTIEEIKKELMKQGAMRKFNDRIRILCIWHF